MGKSAVKSVQEADRMLRSSIAVDGYPCPQNQLVSGTSDASSGVLDGHMVPLRRKRGRKAFLNGSFARRKLPLQAHEYCIWDTELTGFGMRVRPSGLRSWFVRLRQRGTQRRILLGHTKDVGADAARAAARRLLAQAALDGLPKKKVAKPSLTMNAFVDLYWQDLARGWKASTATRNYGAWQRDLCVPFGALHVADIAKADVQRWRDGCAGGQEANFNRAVPVLAGLLKYAEALHLRRKNSNPCRGMPRYKRLARERYLTPLEYRRVARELQEEETTHPMQVAIVRLLIFTGARLSEIRDLRWEWVKPPRLILPDSKTGPKIVWLNRQAIAILDALRRDDDNPLVFPNKRGKRPVALNIWWPAFRRRCALPDVRLHDLRHSFASSAIMDNVPLATIGKLLGHRLTETTARYAHLADEVVADAAQRVSGSLAAALRLDR